MMFKSWAFENAKSIYQLTYSPPLVTSAADVEAEVEFCSMAAAALVTPPPLDETEPPPPPPPQA
jgi:hypothetical protein